MSAKQRDQVLISISRLLHRYVDEQTGETVTAIDDLDLALTEGEFVSILGPSGCGKSTLLYIIAGLIHQTGGEILLEGRPIRGPGPDRGMVFQDYALLPWKNVLDNVVLGLKFQGLPRTERERIGHQFIELVALEGFENRFPHELSGGMRQRVAVARALAANPKVLLMDEPFAAVDAQTRITLQQELVRIWMATRKTVLFVTHSVDEAAFLSDRVVVLTRRPGRVKEIVKIGVARDRRMDEADEEFLRIKEHLLWSVRSEVTR